MGKLSYSGKLLQEFIRFAAKEKIYWIVPLVLVLGLAGILIVSSQGATPFIYALF
jgi:hypothetical protein